MLRPARTVDKVLEGVRQNPGCLDSGPQGYRHSLTGLCCLVLPLLLLLSSCFHGACRLHENTKKAVDV